MAKVINKTELELARLAKELNDIEVRELTEEEENELLQKIDNDPEYKARKAKILKNATGTVTEHINSKGETEFQSSDNDN